MSLDPRIPEALARPDAHPDDPDARFGVDVVQTHLSWVFLTRGRVAKLRKAVSLGFVEFGSREQRNSDCLREVALNRRLAPDVYLGVAPVVQRPDGGFMLGAVGEALAPGTGGEAPEHCVVMRRLAEGCDAVSLLAAGRLGAEHLEALASRLASFHRSAALTSPPAAEAWRDALLRPVEENFRHLAGERAGIDAQRVKAIAAAARAGFESRAACFEARRQGGRVVDGHGDLHLQHVWFEAGPDQPLLIDCLEFDAGLRRIDTASEVAFLAMDLVYRGHPELAEGFLRVYAAESDDFDLYAVVDWFASYRAGVRAKVAVLAAGDADLAPEQRDAATGSARRHLDLCEAYLAQRPPGELLLLCGGIGTGKSTLAKILADARSGVVISSDRTRKRRAGLGPQERAGTAPGHGLYSDEQTEAVYAGLLERAAPVVASGRLAILDATFGRRAQRQAAAAWAADRGIPVRLVLLACDPQHLRRRLVERQARGTDPSDAGPELLAWSLARFQAPDEWPAQAIREIDTGVAGWREQAQRLAEWLPAPWHRSCIVSEPGGSS